MTIGAVSDLRADRNDAAAIASSSAAGGLQAAQIQPRNTGTPNLVEAFALIPDLWPEEPEALSLANTQIISYYGNPYTAAMGILGAGDIETIATQLEARAAIYNLLNGETDVIPALHMVYAVAQPRPTDGGRYLLYVQDEEVERYLRVAEERDMLLFLDIQMGSSTVEDELRRILPYLRNPRVHVALDPEFAVREGQVPGQQIGGISGIDINRAQEILQQLVQEEFLPPKFLIVHQFVDSMVRDGAVIERFPDVELIIDMDGFGPADVKEAIYQRYAAMPYAFNPAIKLFFQQDTDLLSEIQVLLLEPRPTVIIYQ